MITSQEGQVDLNKKLQHIATRILAIESFEEDIKDSLVDVQDILGKEGVKKKIPEIKLIVKAYIDSNKAKVEEENKIQKSKVVIEELDGYSSELSVLDHLRDGTNLYDEADKLAGLV